MSGVSHSHLPCRICRGALRRSRNRGVALIITLVLITLVSVLLVGFISFTKGDRLSSRFYSRSLAIDSLGKGALEAVVGELRQEVIDGSQSDSFTNPTVSVFLPVVDSRTGRWDRYKMSPTEFISATEQAADDQAELNNQPLPFANLVRRSSRASYYQNAWQFNPTVESFADLTLASAPVSYGFLEELLASDVSTLDPALNGAFISQNRWNKPELIYNENVNLETVLTAPDWVYVTRGGTEVFSNTTSDAQRASDDTFANSSYVLGRFAYTIYNVGGLLDASIAGNALTAAENSERSRSHQAVLTEVPGLSSSSAQNLISWRTSASSTWLSEPTNDFLETRPGDQTFIGRQDLIERATQLNFQQALPFLTLHSRFLNAPSWMPDEDINGFEYLSDADTSSAVNRSVLTVRNASGAPIISRRFPLNRLSLLETLDRSNPDPAVVTLISNYFGLTVDSGTQEWTYSGSRILTLQEVIAEGREPNFFELLKTGILSGSLGVGVPQGDSPSSVYTYDYANADNDSAHDEHIIRIGAAIIDQYDADSYPTTINFVSGSVGPNEFYGVESLPYMTKLFFNAYRFDPFDPTPYPNGSTPTWNMGTNAGFAGQFLGQIPWLSSQPNFFAAMMGVLLQPELWNPHEVVNSGGVGPSDLRIIMERGSVFQARISGAGTSELFGVGIVGMAQMAFDDDETMSSNNSAVTFPNDYELPELLVRRSGVTSPNSRNLPNHPDRSSEPSFSSGRSDVGTPAGILVSYHEQFPFPQSDYSSGDGPHWVGPNPNLNPFGVKLQWRDPLTNTWRTYSHWRNIEPDPVNGQNPWGTQPNASTWPIISDTVNWRYDPYILWFAPDGRTNRFGLASTFSGSVGPNRSLANSPGKSESNFNLTPRNRMAGFNFAGSGSNAALGTLAYNESGSSTYYSDRDGIVRPADGTYATNGSSAGHPLYVQTPNNGSTTKTSVNTESRPVILNRPFRSVSELSYAFRDMPFKTLDFTSSVSGDLGLLDLFTVDDASVVAGKISLNSARKEVLEAIINGTKIDPFSSGTTSVLDNSSTDRLAQAIVDQVSDQTATDGGPLLNRSEIVTTLASQLTTIAGANTNLNALKHQRSTMIQALSEIGETRTWNLMVDLIAQSGNISSASGSDMGDFRITGEKRYWLHVSIDRFTGEIIDSVIERVYE
ncbi:MAG: hypothetical protein AAF558_13490 [Verrucomicrobiota bacterium]